MIGESLQEFLDDPSLRVNEVAKIFEVQPRTIREWIKTGKLHGHKLVTGEWRVRTSEVKRFANEKYGD